MQRFAVRSFWIFSQANENTLLYVGYRNRPVVVYDFTVLISILQIAPKYQQCAAFSGILLPSTLASMLRSTVRCASCALHRHHPTRKKHAEKRHLAAMPPLPPIIRAHEPPYRALEAAEDENGAVQASTVVEGRGRTPNCRYAALRCVGAAYCS